MQKKITISILYALLSFASAVETNLVKEYYDISPVSLETLKTEMMQSSHLGEQQGLYHTIGGYEASVTISRMKLMHENGQCKAQVFEMQLNGMMTLPRLKMGNYSLKIRQAFEKEQNELEQHEKVHEKIWQDSLRNFEQYILGLMVRDNESCDQLIDEINQEMAKVFDKILYRNLEFDCISYGDQLKLAQCH